MIRIRARKHSIAIESSMVEMAKQGMIALKMVALIIPRGAEEKAMLEEDLK